MSVLRPFCGCFLAAVIVASSVAMNTNAQAPKATSTYPERCLENEAFQSFGNQAVLAKIGRGFNLPNWDFSHPTRAPKTQTLRLLHERGMRHIRLPVFHEELHLERKAGEFLERLQNSITILTGIGYAVSIDFHPGAEFGRFFERDPGLGFARLTAIWRNLASVAAKFASDDVLVELWNEPEISEELWNDHLPEMVQRVRALLPNHTIVAGPGGPQRPEALNDLPALDDNNIVYAFHFYDPLFFTHQGADWHNDDDPIRALSNVPFPTSLDQPEIKALLQRLRAENPNARDFLISQLDKPWGTDDLRHTLDIASRWSKERGAVVLLNEFGVLDHEAPYASRLFWLVSVRAAVEARCIGWTHWEYQDGFGFVDPETGNPDEAILHGLLSP